MTADTPAAPKPTANPTLAMEQYKAKLTDLGNLGTRQTTMTSYYITIVSALLGVLALKDRPLAQIDLGIVLAIAGAGLLISALWFFSLSFFRKLFRAKLEMLNEIEEALPFQTFIREYEALKKQGAASWLLIERMAPLVFALLFFFLMVVRVLV